MTSLPVNSVSVCLEWTLNLYQKIRVAINYAFLGFSMLCISDVLLMNCVVWKVHSYTELVMATEASIIINSINSKIFLPFHDSLLNFSSSCIKHCIRRKLFWLLVPNKKICLFIFEKGKLPFYFINFEPQKTQRTKNKRK